MGETLLPRLQAAIYRYGMIKPGDRVAVGVSGGKDSIALLSLLVCASMTLATPGRVRA